MKMTAELAIELGLIENRPQSNNFLTYEGLFAPNKFNKDGYFKAIENWKEINNLDESEILDVDLTQKEIYRKMKELYK